MFRHRHIIALASIFLVHALFGYARAEEVHTIRPTGIFPDDVYKVQSVVDDLGVRGVDAKIILAARNQLGEPTAFNFGEGDYFLGERYFVYVWGDRDSGDIAFVGEMSRSAQTTIVGGFLSLFCVRPTTFDVRGIRFEGAEATPIYVLACDSGEIKNNVICNVRGDPFGWGPYRLPKAVGIWVVAGYSWIEDVGGHVEIKDNRISDVVAEYAIGIAVVQTNASFEISGNKIRNVNGLGILASDNQKPVVIEKNRVVPGPGNTPSPFSVGDGIQANFHTPFPLGDEARYRVEGNRVICENPYASGISAYGNSYQPVKNSVFAENHITMLNAQLYGGLGLGAFGGGPGFFDNYVGENIIDGQGPWAIYLGDLLPGALPSEIFTNTFDENDLEDFWSAGMDVIFDEFTHDNFYFGEDETVLDLGHGNIIVLEEDDDDDDDD